MNKKLLNTRSLLTVSSLFSVCLLGSLSLSHAALSPLAVESTLPAYTAVANYINYQEKQTDVKQDPNLAPNVDLLKQDPNLKSDLASYDNALADYSDCSFALQSEVLNDDFSNPAAALQCDILQGEFLQYNVAYQEAKWQLLKDAVKYDQKQK